MKRRTLPTIVFALLASLLSTESPAGSLRQAAGYLLGEQEYVYGFPLVLMDLTREVITATPKSGQYRAPITLMFAYTKMADNVSYVKWAVE